MLAGRVKQFLAIVCLLDQHVQGKPATGRAKKTTKSASNKLSDSFLYTLYTRAAALAHFGALVYSTACLLRSRHDQVLVSDHDGCAGLLLSLPLLAPLADRRRAPLPLSRARAAICSLPGDATAPFIVSCASSGGTISPFCLSTT